MKTFGDIIREKRETKGLSGRAVAKKAGISSAYFTQLETNKFSNPSIKTIKKISDALNIAVIEMLTLAGYCEKEKFKNKT